MSKVTDIIKELELRQSTLKGTDLLASYRKEVIPIIQEFHLLQAKLEAYEKVFSHSHVLLQKLSFEIETAMKLKDSSLNQES